MFNLVSFPIIPSLLVSLNPLAQSWSPCCRTHTHLDSYVRRNTNVHAEVDTSEPWLGFMVVGLRRGSRMSSTPQEGARDLGNQKEREREGQEQRREENKRWETFGRGELVKGSSDEDTSQRSGAERKRRKRRATEKGFRFVLLFVRIWKWRRLRQNTAYCQKYVDTLIHTFLCSGLSLFCMVWFWPLRSKRREIWTLQLTIVYTIVCFQLSLG